VLPFMRGRAAGGSAIHGMAWHGMAWQSTAWCGMAGPCLMHQAGVQLSVLTLSAHGWCHAASAPCKVPEPAAKAHSSCPPVSTARAPG